MVALTADTLPTIDRVPVPTYDRSQLRVGIVHLGVGGFRAPPHEPFADLPPPGIEFASQCPGIGLLGVTFGHLVAMDSPSGRAEGAFHWGTTLWHEIAHVFTLSATDLAALLSQWGQPGPADLTGDGTVNGADLATLLSNWG